jgi:hypothetical protein
VEISATILETGRPALFVSGWFAKMLTAATVVCSTVVAASVVDVLGFPQSCTHSNLQQ